MNMIDFVPHLIVLFIKNFNDLCGLSVLVG